MTQWSETPSEDRPDLSFAPEAQRGQGTAEGHAARPLQKQNLRLASKRLIPSCPLSLPTARRLEHHGALGQGQFPGHPSGGHIPLPHLTLLLRLRQRRLQEFQQQRDPGEGPGGLGRGRA